MLTRAMLIPALAGCAAAAAATESLAQDLPDEVLLSVVPDRETARPGDTVTWTIFADLRGVPADAEIATVVNEITFDVSFGPSGPGTPDAGFELSNNAFNPAFVPSLTDPGAITGNAVLGASGNQDPGAFFGGPPADPSNPLAVYTLDMLILDGTPRVISGGLNITGQFSGSFIDEDGVFGISVFLYQQANGSPGTVPFSQPPLLFLPTLEIIPAPTPAALLAIAGLGLARRRR